jgi:hypothetical protein
MTASALLRRGGGRLADIAVALGPPPSKATVILVLGMHRSGTSAVTGLLHLMGVPVGAADDRMPPDSANAKGYWESRQLTDFQELLLRQLGGSWDAPPLLTEGWERSTRLLPARGRARRLIRRVYGNHALWAWKDPRTSLLLPFWQRALRSRILTVVMHRNPLEVARSLQVRDGLSKRLALDLWETYNRSALANATGLPALVISYDDLLDDPVAAAQNIRHYLIENDVSVAPVPVDRVHGLIDGELRHSRYNDTDLISEPELKASQRALAGTLHSTNGVHAALRASWHSAP